MNVLRYVGWGFCKQPLALRITGSSCSLKCKLEVAVRNTVLLMDEVLHHRKSLMS